MTQPHSTSRFKQRLVCLLIHGPLACSCAIDPFLRAEDMEYSSRSSVRSRPFPGILEAVSAPACFLLADARTEPLGLSPLFIRTALFPCRFGSQLSASFHLGTAAAFVFPGSWRTSNPVFSLPSFSEAIISVCAVEPYFAF